MVSLTPERGAEVESHDRCDELVVCPTSVFKLPLTWGAYGKLDLLTEPPWAGIAVLWRARDVARAARPLCRVRTDRAGLGVECRVVTVSFNRRPTNVRSDQTYRTL